MKIESTFCRLLFGIQENIWHQKAMQGKLYKIDSKANNNSNLYRLSI